MRVPAHHTIDVHVTVDDLVRHAELPRVDLGICASVGAIPHERGPPNAILGGLKRGKTRGVDEFAKLRVPNRHLNASDQLLPRPTEDCDLVRLDRFWHLVAPRAPNRESQSTHLADLARPALIPQRLHLLAERAQPRPCGKHVLWRHLGRNRVAQRWKELWARNELHCRKVVPRCALALIAPRNEHELGEMDTRKVRAVRLVESKALSRILHAHLHQVGAHTSHAIVLPTPLLPLDSPLAQERRKGLHAVGQGPQDVLNLVAWRATPHGGHNGFLCVGLVHAVADLGAALRGEVGADGVKRGRTGREHRVLLEWSAPKRAVQVVEHAVDGLAVLRWVPLRDPIAVQNQRSGDQHRERTRSTKHDRLEINAPRLASTRIRPSAPGVDITVPFETEHVTGHHLVKVALPKRRNGVHKLLLLRVGNVELEVLRVRGQKDCRANILPLPFQHPVRTVANVGQKQPR